MEDKNSQLVFLAVVNRKVGEMIGYAIRDMRIKKKMSLRQLAKAIDVSPAFMSDVEHGRRSTNKLKEIAKVLGVSQKKLKDLDGRVSIELREWLKKNPKVVRMLEKMRRRCWDIWRV